MRAAGLILTALVLGGCAGSQTQLRLLEGQNALRIEPTAGPGFDYTVTVRNLKDIGYDPDVKADRDRVALTAIQSQCPAAMIVKEDVIETGQYLLGNPSRDYFIRIRCRPS